jgi:predicted RNA-binding protein YlxR (DUF448 family)
MIQVRTCVGCRQRNLRSNLIRVVVSENQLVFDPSKSLPGRGAWLHPEADCIELANTRNGFGRALRISNAVISKEQAETMLAKNE